MLSLRSQSLHSFGGAQFCHFSDAAAPAKHGADLAASSEPESPDSQADLGADHWEGAPARFSTLLAASSAPSALQLCSAQQRTLQLIDHIFCHNAPACFRFVMPFLQWQRLGLMTA